MPNENSQKAINSWSRRKLLKSVGAGSGIASFSGTTVAEKEAVSLPTGDMVPVQNVQQAPNSGKGNNQNRPPQRPKLPEPARKINQDESEGSQPATNRNKWLAYVSDTFYNGTYSYMYAEWDVPSKASTYNAVNDPSMFYFSSLMNCLSYCDKKIIIQPVLNWNRFTAGEWEIAAWYVENNNSGAHSPPHIAHVGDHLSGVINKQSDNTWYIDIYNETTGDYTYLYSPDYGNRTFDLSSLTLESANWSNHSACEYLPGSCTFNQIELHDLNGNQEAPEWDKTINDFGCNYSATVHSDSKITIHTP